MKCFNEADNNYCMCVLKCQSTKRNKPHLHVPCHAKVTILGSILTGSSCFVFVFSRDVIKFQSPAPEHLLSIRSRSFLSPWAMMCCPLSMPWLKYCWKKNIYIYDHLKACQLLLSHLWITGGAGRPVERSFSNCHSIWRIWKMTELWSQSAMCIHGESQD